MLSAVLQLLQQIKPPPQLRPFALKYVRLRMHFYELLSCDRTCEVAHMDCDLWSHNIYLAVRTVSAVVFSRLGDGRGAFLSGCKSDHPLVVGAIVNFDT